MHIRWSNYFCSQGEPNFILLPLLHIVPKCPREPDISRKKGKSTVSNLREHPLPSFGVGFFPSRISPKNKTGIPEFEILYLILRPFKTFLSGTEQFGPVPNFSQIFPRFFRAMRPENSCLVLVSPIREVASSLVLSRLKKKLRNADLYIVPNMFFKMCLSLWVYFECLRLLVGHQFLQYFTLQKQLELHLSRGETGELLPDRNAEPYPHKQRAEIVV